MNYEYTDKYKDFNTTLDEGILYDKNRDAFTLNYYNDTSNSVVLLSKTDILWTKHNDKVLFYGYKLKDEKIDSNSLLAWLKSKLDGNQCVLEITKLINDAVDLLHKSFNLNSFKCIVYPDSTQNKLVNDIIHKIHITLYDYETPVTHYSTIRSLPDKIEFDWKRFKEDNPELYAIASNQIINTERKQRRTDIEDRIHKLLENIHSQSNFKALESGFNANERKYLRNFFTVRGIDSNCLLYNLKDAKQVLLVDDALNSRTDLVEMIRAISVINPDCDITVFSLII